MVQGGRRINPGSRRSNGKAFIKRILSELWPANSRFNLKGHSAAEPQQILPLPPRKWRRGGKPDNILCVSEKRVVVSRIVANHTETTKLRFSPPASFFPIACLRAAHAKSIPSAIKGMAKQSFFKQIGNRNVDN
jgi:hypothetical protein